ncbi:rhodanese domain-containing protein CG4456-like [Aricia agestis]|uniref:rhodanese domain-containing protein CG4456-like n=1 Tax=Aricia agestis TaxID=91739 RepID=UPI001C206A3E|nr:rhodanese domain-containing protein CG4456-like [Aricia agestis]
MLRRIILPINYFSERFGSTLSTARSVCKKREVRETKNVPRYFSEYLNSNKHDVDFEQVKNAVNNDNVYIIDVREPEEIKELGKIPNSINIPLDKVYTTLSAVNDEVFKKIYKRSRPTEDSQIIFYCAIGKRSGMAQKSAYDLGYKNAKNYVGSYTDWTKKNNKEQSCK